jgi:hypothetical protein
MAATWTPIAGYLRSVQSVQALTETAPSGNDGISLFDVASVVPVLHAPNGQTFTGAGTLLGYVKTALGAWVRQASADLDVSELSGLQDGTLRAVTIASPRERLAYIASGIGLSGGTQITMELFAISPQGRDL